MQIIFHIDLNAFYASAEIAMDPSLGGQTSSCIWK